MANPKFSRGARIYPNLAALDESMPNGHTWGMHRKGQGWCSKEERIASVVIVQQVRRGHESQSYRGNIATRPVQYKLEFGDGRRAFYDAAWVDAHFRSEAEHVENLLGLACGDDRFPAVIHARNQLMDIGDQLTIAVSAVRGDRYESAFENLLQSWGRHQYRPTLSVRDPAAKALADIYDFTQAARGVSVVAFRSHG